MTLDKNALEAAHKAALQTWSNTGDPVPSLRMQRACIEAYERAKPAPDFLPVEEIEMVRQAPGTIDEVPAGSIWRVCVGGCCADFETEMAANNFRAAIAALIPKPAPDVAGLVAECLEAAEIEERSGGTKTTIATLRAAATALQGVKP